MSNPEACDDSRRQCSPEDEFTLQDLARAMVNQGLRGKAWMSLNTLARVYADLGVRNLRSYLQHPTHPLPARLVGGKWLVHREEFDSWLRSFPRAGEDLDRLVDEVINEFKKGAKTL